MVETVLIFPAGVPGGLDHKVEAEARGLKVVGASSLEYDPIQREFGAWERLPFIHEEGFESALATAVRRHGVTRLFTPHFITWLTLSERLGSIAPEVQLVGGPALLEQEGRYRELRLAAAAESPILLCGPAPAQPALNPAHRAGILRLVNGVPGMTDADKIAALFEVARRAPSGDVVEVGSWWGRSALLLLLLAQAHRIGPLLCVDPWTAEGLVQDVDLVDRASSAMDTDEALRIFEINLRPFAKDDVNYLRLPSTDGAAAYRRSRTVASQVFGEVRYAGEIALLHIDGNHTERAAAEDVAAWAPLVRPGGWIVVDDYVWAFGDGPRRAGDALLEQLGHAVDCAFVTGTALFIQLAGAR